MAPAIDARGGGRAPSGATTKDRVSIRDVSARVGCSHTTVSLALRGDPRITPALRLRIRAAAEALGYQADTVVSALMGRLRTLRVKSMQATIGLITAWPTRDGWKPWANHRRFVQGATKRASELGYGIDEFWLTEPGMTGERMTEVLRARGVRGLILFSLPAMGGKLELRWEYFACVTKGLTVSYPPVHRVVSSHYEDMQLVLRELGRRRYRRIGLVLSSVLSMRVDRAWLAAFLVHQNDLDPGDRVPALIVRPGQEASSFRKWFSLRRPDVILFSEQPIQRWLAQMKVAVPREVGLVHLNWSDDVGPIAGLDSDPETLGVAALDLLAGQLQANEFGVPKHEKIVAVRGFWVDGRSVRKPPGKTQQGRAIGLTAAFQRNTPSMP